MIYLSSFTLPSCDVEEECAHDVVGYYDNPYPFGVFTSKMLEQIVFENITIFYGNNGSGKSTLLNLIAEKLNLSRSSFYNKSKYFDAFADLCSYQPDKDEEGLERNISRKSRIIISEDIFESILNVRQENLKIEKRRATAADDYITNKMSEYEFNRFNSLDDFERLSKQNEAKSRSQRSFINRRANREIRQFSNGETAISYFDREFGNGCLYLLDEPENSLSPRFQLQLADLINDCVQHCDCQFIIATHSPILLSLGMVYDLDSVPVTTRNWNELENVKIFYSFFKDNEKRFTL